MGARQVLIFALLVLSGCGPTVDPAAKDAAIDAVFACYRSRAAALDDHVSDALSVALEVRNACHAEIENEKAVFGAGLPPTVFHGRFSDKIDQGELGHAEQIVLLQRQ
jgi:hypothetical protein